MYRNINPVVVTISAMLHAHRQIIIVDFGVKVLKSWTLYALYVEALIRH